MIQALQQNVTVRALTVTLNPTLDVATRVKRLVNHEKLRCETEAEQVGGGGLNVAQVMRSLGADCTAALTSGGWRGKEIERRLLQDDIHCLSMPVAAESRQCFTVYETSSAQEYRFILPGPTLSETEAAHCLDMFSDAALKFDWLIMSGSLPPGIPSNFYQQLLERVASCGIKTALDTSGAALEHALRARVDVIKPSREELEQLTGLSLNSLEQCRAACQSVLRQGHVSTIALSLGGQGALVCQNDIALHVSPLPVEITSTVGAGDSFLGGLIWSMSQHDTLERACQTATAAAAAALQTQGKLMFNRESILRAADQVSVQALT